MMGVAIGIIIGGAGSLFWLLVSMLFAMVIKYSEVVLTSDNLYHDSDTHGGIYYALRSSLGGLGDGLSRVYSVAVLLLSFVMGAALQTDAIIESADQIIRLPPLPIAIFIVVFAFTAIIGGTRKIEKITAIVIPLTTIIYIFITTSVIFTNADKVPSVLLHVVRSAFSLKSGVGGILGFLLSTPRREGFVRGILSNEAGAGTSAMAHARSGVLNPASAGILGIFEVWFDTGLICTLTGLSILVSVPDPSAFSDGMQIVSFTVGNLFGFSGKVVLFLSVFAFAFATLICWYYYGSEAFGTLFGKRKRATFLPLFLLAVFLGCFADTMLLVALTDMLILVATILTLLALIKNSDRIRDLSELGGAMDSESGRLRRLRIRNITGILSSRVGKGPKP